MTMSLIPQDELPFIYHEFSFGRRNDLSCDCSRETSRQKYSCSIKGRDIRVHSAGQTVSHQVKNNLDVAIFLDPRVINSATFQLRMFLYA
jgi:hypothetical protein